MAVRTVRIPRSKIYDDPIHKLPFLDWVQEQTERIQDISNVIEEVKELESFKRVIAISKIQECLARYMEFYSANIAFLQVYIEYKELADKQSDELYDLIYLDLKRRVTDPTDEIGAKYAKKAATMKEIESEFPNHPRYEEYVNLKDESRIYEKKVDAQNKYIKGLDKWDIILESLKKRDEKEIKYLYLET